jgi:hypothetical protein
MIWATTGHPRRSQTVPQATKVDVKVSKGADLTWMVSLDQRIVGQFTIVGDALAYASMLECDPRIRGEAVPA